MRRMMNKTSKQIKQKGSPRKVKEREKRIQEESQDTTNHFAKTSSSLEDVRKVTPASFITRPTSPTGA